MFRLYYLDIPTVVLIWAHKNSNSISILRLRVWVELDVKVDWSEKWAHRNYTKICRTGWPKAGPERVVPGPKVGVDLPQE
ncbi:hypothetical protein ACRALDRAFT_2016250 [Sodiomyces alcalophilus JCM 7366]|uniref:uncharacterized protein n=1 Tax=Sodiomyces alcalophilus JCM 7366 TaxID=591952 RepID=UPI0039B4A327